MAIGSTLPRIPARLAFWALAGLALLLSHDAIFLVQSGPGESLARTLREAGHAYWGLASLGLAVIGLAAALGAWIRIRALRRHAERLGVDRAEGARFSRLLPVWLRLFTAVATGFLLQENLEHSLTHLHIPGLAVLLGPEYPLALPVIGLVSGVAALLACAVTGVERALLDAIAAVVPQCFGHAPRALWRPPIRLAVVRLSPLAQASAGRAPPRAVTHH